VERAIATLLRKLAASNKSLGSRSRESRRTRAILYALGHRGGLRKNKGCVVPDTPKRTKADATLAEVLAESARLKRQSAALLKRATELDEHIANRLPLVGATPKPPRKG
jgi:hypothetical protein